MSNSEINKNRNNKKPGEVKKDHAVDIKFLAMDLPRIFASMSYGLIYGHPKIYISNIFRIKSPARSWFQTTLRSPILLSLVSRWDAECGTSV